MRSMNRELVPPIFVPMTPSVPPRHERISRAKESGYPFREAPLEVHIWTTITIPISTSLIEMDLKVGNHCDQKGPFTRTKSKLRSIDRASFDGTYGSQLELSSESICDWEQLVSSHLNSFRLRHVDSSWIACFLPILDESMELEAVRSCACYAL